ncbi:UNVERIFIED_CONTAM: hypothetical protein HDU68_012314 [Siphonaria sp. JEL0065]|nr:hypothetical protein HDU68_012314 [Siphonaria sp. JEL0065]
MANTWWSNVSGSILDPSSVVTLFAGESAVSTLRQSCFWKKTTWLDVGIHPGQMTLASHILQVIPTPWGGSAFEEKSLLLGISVKTIDSHELNSGAPRHVSSYMASVIYDKLLKRADDNDTEIISLLSMLFGWFADNRLKMKVEDDNIYVSNVPEGSKIVKIRAQSRALAIATMFLLEQDIEVAEGLLVLLPSNSTWELWKKTLRSVHTLDSKEVIPLDLEFGLDIKAALCHRDEILQRKRDGLISTKVLESFVDNIGPSKPLAGAKIATALAISPPNVLLLDVLSKLGAEVPSPSSTSANEVVYLDCFSNLIVGEGELISELIIDSVERIRGVTCIMTTQKRVDALWNLPRATVSASDATEQVLHTAQSLIILWANVTKTKLDLVSAEAGGDSFDAMMELSLKNLAVVSDTQRYSLQVIHNQQILWSRFGASNTRFFHNMCWMPVAPVISEVFRGQVRGLRFPSPCEMLSYPWLTTRPHKSPSNAFVADIDIDGCLRLQVPIATDVQFANQAKVLDNPTNDTVCIHCEHGCKTLSGTSSGTLFEFPCCFIESLEYSRVVFQENLLILSKDSRHLVGAIPTDLLKIKISNDLSSISIGASDTKEPFPYSVVSHVFGAATLRGITHMWGVRMPEKVQINRNTAKRAFIRWLYAREEKVWMDIFNNNQHDMRVLSKQVAVMDILYARSERCYIILECAKAATNFNKLLNSVKFTESTIFPNKSLLRNENILVKPTQTGDEWELKHVLLECSDKDWDIALEQLLKDTNYRTRVWTMQEELLSKNKVIVIAYPENDCVYLVSHKRFPVYYDLSVVTTEKLKECDFLYEDAIKYRAMNDLGYDSSSIKKQVLAALRDYSRECYRPVDHVFAVYRLVGIEMETDYHDDIGKILQEWEYKCIKAGILLPPYATHRPYRLALNTDSCWKSLYLIPSPDESFQTHQQEGDLHIEDIGPPLPPKDVDHSDDFPTSPLSPTVSISKLQSEIFCHAYRDSGIQLGRIFDFTTTFAANGRDLIVREVDGPLMESRVDRGNEIESSEFVIIMKHKWTEVRAKSDIGPEATFYPTGDTYEKHIRGLVQLPKLVLPTDKNSVIVTIFCEEECLGEVEIDMWLQQRVSTAKTSTDRVGIIRLETDDGGSRYAVVVRNLHVNCIRIVGNLPFLLPGGKVVRHHVFGGGELLWD